MSAPHRRGDVDMASAWECSRNDVAGGAAVIAATIAVWLFHAVWPDLFIAVALLILCVPPTRVLRQPSGRFGPSKSPADGDCEFI